MLTHLLTVYIVREWTLSVVSFTRTPIALQQMNVLEMYGIIITDGAVQAGYKAGSWILKLIAMFLQV